MQHHLDVTPEWRQWLLDALEAGSTPASLLATMLEHQFDPQVARRTLIELTLGPPAADGAPVQLTHYVSDIVRLPEGNVIRTLDRDVRVLARLSKPVIAVLDQVLDEQECETFKQLAASRLARSKVVENGSGKHTVMDYRTSDGAYFPRDENAFITRIEQRVAALMNWPAANGEGFQVMRYGIGGEYRPHYDYFLPSDVGSAMHLKHGGQRVSTLIIYLNDVEEGGETLFPAINFSYVPRKGQALYFEYCNQAGVLDPLTLHGGAAVKRGEKWIATQWMREGEFKRTL